MTFRLFFDGHHFRSISHEKYMAGVRGVAQNVAKQAIGYLLFQLTNADGMKEYDESKWMHYEGGTSEFVSGRKFLCDDARPRAIMNNIVVSSP